MWIKNETTKDTKDTSDKEGIIETEKLRAVDNAKKELKKQSLPTGYSRSMVGKGLVLKGELTGSDDVVIQGRIEGTINLKNNYVIVGEGAFVMANTLIKELKVEGTVKGDIEAVDRVLVTEKGNVEGNIIASKVVLNEGCVFKGNVSMTDSSSLPKIHNKK